MDYVFICIASSPPLKIISLLSFHFLSNVTVLPEIFDELLVT